VGFRPEPAVHRTGTLTRKKSFRPSGADGAPWDGHAVGTEAAAAGGSALQATGDNTHVTGAQTQAFPKTPDGVTGVRVGYYAESGVEYLYLATDETIVAVPVGGVAGEYVEVHVVVSADKVSLTANVDGLNDMGAFTFSTFADSFGSTHAAHEVAHAMTGGAFDLYVGAVADELASGNQALFLSLSVVGPTAGTDRLSAGRKLLATEEAAAASRDGAAELTEAEAALNWAGPEQASLLFLTAPV